MYEYIIFFEMFINFPETSTSTRCAPSPVISRGQVPPLIGGGNNPSETHLIAFSQLLQYYLPQPFGILDGFTASSNVGYMKAEPMCNNGLTVLVLAVVEGCFDCWLDYFVGFRWKKRIKD